MSHFLNILIASLEHPDKTFREHLSNKIDLWISSKKPKHSKDSIEKAILECKGTPIEPFILRKKHLHVSLMLAMLAFTKEENQRVVRLVSEDTFGVNTGGCLLKDDLSFSYHENFYKGKKPKYKENNWFSCPWKYPSRKKNKIKANLGFSENGYKIKINNLNLELLGWKDPNYYYEVMSNSYILPEAKNFDSLGCSIRFENQSIEIETKSTDNMLKLSVYLMRKSILILDPGDRWSPKNRTLIAIKLMPAISEDVELFVTPVSYGNIWIDWFNYDCKNSPEIDVLEKIEIMGEIYPPLEWIDNNLMSSL